MFGLPKFGDGIGLHRIEQFFETHGVDVDRLSQRSIVVTGSNGKGSTSRFLAAAMSAAGLRAGLFTSPHLFDVRERFVIGDMRIPQDVFERHAATVLAFTTARPEGDRIGAFEFLFLIAILWFEEEQPDVMIWEAGIGGRYDPVRTVRARQGVLTGLELEHTQILGATEELIAYDKIDALDHGGRLTVSPSVPTQHYPRIAAYCRLAQKTPFFLAAELEIEADRNTAHGIAFRFRDRGATAWTQGRLSLLGRHQVDNALTAFFAARDWLHKHMPFDPAALLRSIGAAAWAGRLERVAIGPDLWVDVGHTPKALDLVTAAFLDVVPREKALIVFGVSASKEVARIAEIVASRFDHFILTRAHKAGADIAMFADAFAGKDAVAEPDIAKAARLARERAEREGLTVLALGGLFLAVETQHAWTGGDPAGLDFL